ncbi:DsrE family protein [Sulfurimonas sp.]|jgi:hypothetical protein|uniref:DsrE family protein n=1 Tax=Sulfurimonas sp. TaxID=2022749 RepID=UPI0025FC36CE|nr:DsrE family protein [Sulfurimonas sp.]MCK9473253.1 DsrE family protein [Sulfurimonas sp.]MDD3505424.1 DsrE family protein [Sulfurimonas sp.]
MLKRVIAVFIIFLSLLRADGDLKKAVFDLTTSDFTTFENRVIKAVAFNKTHYESKFQELDIIVIVHGGAYKFFVKDLTKTKYKDDKKVLSTAKDIEQRLISLIKTYNVKFQVCGAGLKKNKVEEENIYSFVEVIPSAMVGLIDAQSSGYAYIPIQ